MLKKLYKSIRSSYSPVVFRYDCSLETHLELWKEKKQPKKQYLGICFFFPRTLQDNFDMHLDFKK